MQFEILRERAETVIFVHVFEIQVSGFRFRNAELARGDILRRQFVFGGLDAQNRLQDGGRYTGYILRIMQRDFSGLYGRETVVAHVRGGCYESGRRFRSGFRRRRG